MLGVSTGRMSKGGNAELRKRLYHTDPYEFEKLVADLWEREGWDTTVSPSVADGGIDVRAEQTGVTKRKAVIQAKRYSEGNKVTPRDIREYAGVRQREVDADEMVIVTTSTFTSGAKREAEELNIKLIDGDELMTMVTDYDDLVAEYVPSVADIEVENRDDAASAAGTESAVSRTPKRQRFTIKESAGLLVLVWLVQTVGLIGLWSPETLTFLTVDTWSIVFALSWITSPAVVMMDSITLHRADASVRPNRVVSPLYTFFLSWLGLTIYILRRRALAKGS